MPKIKSVSGFDLYIYADDHNPPHFHAVNAERQVLISIENPRIIAGKVSQKTIADVIKWANDNQAFLMEKWLIYNERK